MAVVVTYVDDQVVRHEKANRWTMLTVQRGPQLMSSPDIVLYAGEEPLAIIGTGTYKSIVMEDS